MSSWSFLCLLRRVDGGERGGSNGRAEAEVSGLYVEVVGRYALSLLIADWPMGCMTV